jgi:hypothetical protein
VGGCAGTADASIGGSQCFERDRAKRGDASGTFDGGSGTGGRGARAFHGASRTFTFSGTSYSHTCRSAADAFGGATRTSAIRSSSHAVSAAGGSIDDDNSNTACHL